MNNEKIVKKDINKLLDNFFFIYALIGLVLFILSICPFFSGDILNSITMFFSFYCYAHLYVLSFVFLIHCLCNNYELNKKKKMTIIISVIDTLLALVVNCSYVFYVNYYIFKINNYLFYGLGLLYSLMPISFHLANKEKIDSTLVKRVVTRVAMIIILVAVFFIASAFGSIN